MLFKKRDDWARPLAEYDVIAALPDSVVEKPLGRLEERAPRGGVAPSARTRSPQSAADLPGAVKADLPATLAPQLATLATSVPASGEWIYEIKFDGYRLLARIEQRSTLASSPATATTGPPSSKPLAAAVEALGIQAGVARRRDRRAERRTARPTSTRCRTRSTASRTDEHRLLPVRPALSRRPRPAPGAACARGARCSSSSSRRKRAASSVRFSADFDGRPGAASSTSACAAGAGRHHRQARRRALRVGAAPTTWLKLKCQRAPGVRDRRLHRPRRARPRKSAACCSATTTTDGKLQYAGNVGTGWNAATGADLRKRLAKIEVGALAVRTRYRQAGTLVEARRRRRSAGSSQSWWPRSVSPSGRPTAASASRCSRGCAATSRPARSRAKPRPRRRARQRLQRTERAP